MTEGSAFERPALRQDVLRALERTSGRRVLPLGATASVEEAGVKALAARLVQENPGLGRYDWREPHCGAHADVLTALQRGVDAIYRVSSMRRSTSGNNDNILWSFHRARWESTPCGARRDEDFLQDCYQHQWLSSTFRDACLRPCEDSPDGRERLLRVLRDAGCERLDPS